MDISKATWIIADPHFNHENIIKYARRPFAHKQEMDRILMENWNSVVHPVDDVLILGDFIVTNNVDDLAVYIKKLNGFKTLLMGNHDRNHDKRSFLKAGCVEVIDHPILWNNYFLFSHEPVDWIDDMLPILNIHGHIHEKKHFNLSNHHYNASVENLSYTPIQLVNILKTAKELNEQ